MIWTTRHQRARDAARVYDKARTRRQTLQDVLGAAATGGGNLPGFVGDMYTAAVCAEAEAEAHWRAAQDALMAEVNAACDRQPALAGGAV